MVQHNQRKKSVKSKESASAFEALLVVIFPCDDICSIEKCAEPELAYEDVVVIRFLQKTAFQSVLNAYNCLSLPESLSIQSNEKEENVMKKKKQKVAEATMMDAIKAMRRGNREAQQELLGPGFHSFNRLHKSKKTYTRKTKHKRNEE
jgi:hypothetical protein